MWTLVRFFDQNFNFDLVGQQVIAHQWLSGYAGGGAIGQTNYLLKILFVYMPFDLIPIAPELRLLFMTLLVNVATFVLLIIVLEKIWREFFPKTDWTLYLLILWRSLVAGSVYWIQYTNSRNLEVIGGLFMVLLGIRILKQPSWQRYIGFLIFSAVVLFADPLQLYMSLVPLFIYAAALWIRHHDRTLGITTLRLGVTAIGSYIGANLLFWTATKIWGINFVVADRQPTTEPFWSFIVNSVLQTIKQMASLYVGGHEFGPFVEALNLMFFCAILGLACYYIWQRIIPAKFALLWGSVWITDIAIYIASGQALKPGTSRYLMMTIPYFILLAASAAYYTKTYRKYLVIATSIVIFISLITLISSLVTNWDPGLSKNKHVFSAMAYMQQDDYTYEFASMDTALPSTYLFHGTIESLPLSCTSNRELVKSYLFFDHRYYDHVIASSHQKEVPIILDGSTIQNSPSTCTIADIRAEFGPWLRVEYLSDQSAVLIYDANELNAALNAKARQQSTPFVP